MASSSILRLRKVGFRCAGSRRILAALAIGSALAPAMADEQPASAADAQEQSPIVVAQEQQPPQAEEPEPEPPSSEEPSALTAEPGIEVIHVRGRGVGGLETDVPSSLTQFDAATIQALGAQDISDLSRVTPNVNIIQPGSTQAIFFVRGIGLSDFSSNAQGAVTVFQDDVSLNAPAIQTGQIFDVEGVDVVRGPQGSGPFRNASGGAIRVRSRRPTGNYTAQLRSTIARYDAKGGKGAEKGLIQDYEGALEFPIVESLLSSRFAFRLNEAEPYVTNSCGNAPPFEARSIRPNDAFGSDDARLPAVAICGERSNHVQFGMLPIGGVSQIPVGLPDTVNDKHNWAARGMLAFQPQDTETKLFVNFHGSRLDQDSTLGQAMGTLRVTGIPEPLLGGPTSAGYREPDQAQEFEQLCNRNTFNLQCQNPYVRTQLEKNLAQKRPLDIRPYRGDYDRVGQETRDTWGGFGSAEIEIGEATSVFLLGSYDTYERVRDQDTDFTPDVLFEQVEEDEAWQTYEEARLGGELPWEPIQWEIGGYYLQEHLQATSDTVILGGNGFFRDFSQKTLSFGGWGELSWDFLDDFTLEAGVRWNWEKKDFHFFRQLSIQGTPTVPASAEQSEIWRAPTGQIILTYHLSEDSHAYGRYTRGFKTGHFNALASENLRDPPANEEYNDAWEAGLRARWFGGAMSATAAFFYYRYENYQVFLFRDIPAQPPVLEIRNAKEAENYGVEVETSLSPLRGWAPRLLEGLVISANFSWLHGEYLDFQIFGRKQIGQDLTLIPIDFSGKQLQNAPQYKVAATADWTFDLGRFGYLVPRYDLSWEDDKFFDPNEGRGTGSRLASVPPLPEYAAGQPAYFLHNVRLAYRTPTGNVEIAGWIRNLTDETYKNFAFDATNFSGVLINFLGEPRTIGMDLTITF